MPIKVSIAMATYNGEKYLGEQLRSFTAQTRQPDELIICEDASTDGTLAIIYEFAATAPFDVKVFPNEKNVGYVRTFSRALELCSGDYVFLSDQDDVWLPEKISQVLSCFDSDPKVQLVIHDLEYCKEDLNPIGQTKIERMTGIFDLDELYVTGMATAVRKPFLDLCLPVPDAPGITHDSWLHQCAYVSVRKKVLHKVLALYRRHGANVTAADDLNVDFITTPEHFGIAACKQERRHWNVITRLIGLFKNEREIGPTTLSPELLWYQAHRAVLVEKFHLDPAIERSTDDKITAVNDNRERQRFLCRSRLLRPVSVIKFYLQGKYNLSGGWQSMVKDLLVK